MWLITLGVTQSDQVKDGSVRTPRTERDWVSRRTPAFWIYCAEGG